MSHGRAVSLLVVLALSLSACLRQAPPTETYLPRVELDIAPTATFDESGVLRINAGGPEITHDGVVWHADQNFAGGYTYVNNVVADIAGTTNDQLYRTERSASSNLGSFSYRIPVPGPGTYRINLHLAEIYWGVAGGAPNAGGPGKRVFSANIMGGPVELSNYDLNAEVGPATAVVKSYDVTIGGGSCFSEIDIVFTATVNRPKLSGLEIATLSSPAALRPMAETNPSVVGSEPLNCQLDVKRDVAIVTDLDLPNAGVDESTLSTSTVLLYRSADGAPVPGIPNTSGGNDSLVYQPDALLDANTRYTFEVTSGVKDEAGFSFVPFRMEFETGNQTSLQPDPRVSFTRSTVFEGTPFFSVVIGPDRKLYAAGLNGTIHRWQIDGQGMLRGEQIFRGLEGRAVVGLAFDPNETSDLFVWTTHNDSVYVQPAEDFTGQLSRLRIRGINAFEADIVDYLVGLPRSTKDHMTNSIAFGPDGMLYLSQGGNTAMGAPDATWGNRPERLLSAAILQVDPDIPTDQLPIDVQTEAYQGSPGNYDPFAPDAPVKLYATGLRNAYDLVWHSNGFLYVPINGSNAGGNAPASPDGTVPAIINGPTQDDYLAVIAPDLFAAGEVQYFGHPNPTRGQYVLNGGNPTAGVDPYEVVSPSTNEGYPVGVMPDPDFRGFVWNFGRNRSTNGALEYQSETFGGALKGKLLVTEYSAGKNVIALEPEANGQISPAGATLVYSEFIGPLDLAEDTRNGNIYVAEYQSGQLTGRISLLRANDSVSTNLPPVVDAGADQTVNSTNNFATLSGTASDPDGDLLTYQWAQLIGPSTVVFADPTSLATTVTFGADGTYVLALTADDGALDTTDSLTVEVVTVPNTAPTAFDASFTTTQDSPVNVVLQATDPENDPLTYTVTDQPANGTLAGTTPNLTYTPNAGHSGPDSFTFTATDGEFTSNTATITVTTTSAQVVARINAGGPSLTINGITWSGDQHFTGGATYRNPNIPDILGTTDDDLYRTERSATTDLGTFNYNIPVPTNGTYEVRLHFAEIHFDATCCIQRYGLGPTSQPDPYLQAQNAGDRVFNVNLQGGPIELENYDISADVGPETAVIKTFDTTTTNNTINITLNATINRPKISAIEIIQLNTTPPTNTAPTANDATYTTTQNTPTTITLNATDPDNDPLTYTITTQPTNGTLTGTPTHTTPNLTYTPNPNHTGTDTFTYTANDGQHTSNTATITINTIGGEVVARINTGGPSLTIDGVSWSGDQHFSGGATYRNVNIPDILGTTDDDLYRTERSATSDLGSFSYSVPVPSHGTYRVRLHFAEIHFGATCCVQRYGLGPTSEADPYLEAQAAGKRVFSVNLQGGPVELENYDISAEVGPETAVIKTYEVTTDTNTIEILLSASVNRPKISAIEIIRLP